MKVVFAADHAGFELKKSLLLFVRGLGYDVEDVGAHVYDELDDYPDVVEKAASLIAANPEARGIIIGGSGQGEAMAANRTHGVRAAVYYGAKELLEGGAGDDILELSREHNDANILSIGARFVSVDEAKQAVETWLSTPFSGEARHRRRIDKLDTL